MGGRDLAAAGISDPHLRASYEICRRLNALHGRTYYLATLLLPPAKRPYVHALYGFARHADEIVDDTTSGVPTATRVERLRELRAGLRADVRRGRSEHPVCAAVVDTVLRWEIPLDPFETFLGSMESDLTVTSYATFADLAEYVQGSAVAVGWQMVPVLEPTSAQAYDHAADLGMAFQLANFVRDVGEDLDRGRLYLPLEDLARFGLERPDLERRVVDDRVRDLLRFEVARVRRYADAARPGIDLLHPTSRPCVEVARVLYCGIVDEVERADYQVFDHRAVVPRRRRLAVALPAWRRALQARRS